MLFEFFQIILMLAPDIQRFDMVVIAPVTPALSMLSQVPLHYLEDLSLLSSGKA